MTRRTIIDVDRVECRLVDAPWPFALECAGAIENHWRERCESNPHLFNGRVLMLESGGIDTGPDGKVVFRGACLETDFKVFMAWREFGHPQTGVRNIFSMAAIETADGAYVLGEMGAHTAPAGQIYFPSGTPDRSDVADNRVDIEGSATRELLEETGLTPPNVAVQPGLTLVIDPVRVCCMKPVRVAEAADALVERIEAWLRGQTTPELARMHVVRSVADLSPKMPEFVQDYLRYRLENPSPTP